MTWVAALRLGGAVEIEVVVVDSSVGTEPSSLWAGAWPSQKCWWKLFLSGDCCFDVKPSAFGVAFALEVDVREGGS